MSDLISDGDVGLLIRTKLNGILDLLKIAETDEAITAGAVTTVPIVTTSGNLLASGETVIMIDQETGEAYTLTLAAALLSSATSMTISSYTFAADVASGAKIYFPMTKFLSIVYNHLNP